MQRLDLLQDGGPLLEDFTAILPALEDIRYRHDIARLALSHISIERPKQDFSESIRPSWVKSLTVSFSFYNYKIDSCMGNRSL